MAIKTSDLRAFFTAQLSEAFPVFQVVGAQPWDQLEAPDLIIRVTPAGGPGFTTEELAEDQQLVTIECRGAQMDPDAGEELAWSVDAALVGRGLMAGYPFTAGSVEVRDVDRASGPPAFAEWDEANRAVFACHYLFTTPTDY